MQNRNDSVLKHTGFFAIASTTKARMIWWYMKQTSEKWMMTMTVTVTKKCASKSLIIWGAYQAKYPFA